MARSARHSVLCGEDGRIATFRVISIVFSRSNLCTYGRGIWYPGYGAATCFKRFLTSVWVVVDKLFAVFNKQPALDRLWLMPERDNLRTNRPRLTGSSRPAGKHANTLMKFLSVPVPDSTPPNRLFTTAEQGALRTAMQGKFFFSCGFPFPYQLPVNRFPAQPVLQG